MRTSSLRRILRSSAEVTHEQRLEVARILMRDRMDGNAPCKGRAAAISTSTPSSFSSSSSTTTATWQQQQRVATTLSAASAPPPTAAAVGVSVCDSVAEGKSTPGAKAAGAGPTPRRGGSIAQTPLRDDRVRDCRESGGGAAPLGTTQSPDGAGMSPSSTACSPSNPQFTVNSSLGGGRPDRLTLKLSPSTVSKHKAQKPIPGTPKPAHAQALPLGVATNRDLTRRFAVGRVR